METTINRANFQKVLEIAKIGTASAELIEQTTSFIFKDGAVFTYNDEISVSCILPEDIGFEGIVEANNFLSIVSKLRGTELTLQKTENELLINSGKSKVGIACKSDITLPLFYDILSATDWQKLPSDFIENIQAIEPICGNSPTRIILTCIKISSDGEYIGSNDYSILKIKGIKKPKFDCLLPAKMCSQISKIKPIESILHDGWLHLRNADGVVLSCRIFVDEYPNVDKFFNSFSHKSEVHLPKTILDILERGQVFYQNSVKIEETVQLHYVAGKFTLECRNEFGWYKESTKTKYEGPDLHISIAPVMLQRAIDVVDTPVLLSTSTFLIKKDNWMYFGGLKNK